MQVSLDLQRVIAGAYHEGRGHFGDLGLDLQTYSDRIQSIVGKSLGLSPAEDAVIAFVKALHGRDLYLTTACAKESLLAAGSIRPNPEEYPCLAWKTLEDKYKVFINDLARFFSRQKFLSKDLADDMFADLFFLDNSGTSRIASYDGRSSLCTWLRVVFCNRAINAWRSPLHSHYSQTGEVDTDFPDRLALVKIDRVMCSARYEPLLANSLARVCGGLTAPERLLLLWRYEDGLQLQQIARLLKIHPSNVTRRLERVYAKLRHQVISSLSVEHGLSKAAIRECLEDALENPNHGISILESIRESGSKSKSADSDGASGPRNCVATWPNIGMETPPPKKRPAPATAPDGIFKAVGKIITR